MVAAKTIFSVAGSQVGEVYFYGLIVAVYLAVAHVTAVPHGSLRGLEVVVEDEVLVRQNLAARSAHQGGGVEIELLTSGRAGVPPEAYSDCAQRRGELGQADVPTLGE